MELDDFLAQGQSEPGAAFLASDLNEGFEDPTLLTVSDALAIVLDADNHPFAMAPGLQADLAATGGMAQGVVDQIVQDPFQLRTVGVQAR